ncbi:MAG: MFS transporter [Candidatus Thermoplasmatota archaeon]
MMAGTETLGEGIPKSLQRNLSLDGAMTRALEGLTGGAVLAGLLLALGAGDAAIGLAAAVPFLAQAAQIPALSLAFRVRTRRMICLGASAISRILLALGGILSVVLPHGVGLVVLIVFLSLSSVAGAVGAFSWAYWMRDLVPADSYGTVFAKRFAWQSGVGLVATLAAGAFLTLGSAGNTSFAFLFIVGGAAGLVGLAFIARLPDVPLNPADGPETPVELFRRAVGTSERAPLAFAALWGLGAMMAVPFVPIFLLADLHAPFITVAILAAGSVLAALVTAPAWGRLTDRVGCKPVLAFASLTSGLAILGLVLVEDTRTSSLVVLAGVHIVMGASLAAVEISLGKLIARAAPFNRAGGFLAVAGMARALGSGLGVLVAGLVAGLASVSSLAFVVQWTGAGGVDTLGTIRVGHFDFVFVLSALLMLYATHRVLGLDEPEVRGHVNMIRELHVELSGLSPFRGARSIGRFAHHAGRLIRERRHFVPWSNPPRPPP